MPGTIKQSNDITGERGGGSRRDELVQFNNSVADATATMSAFYDAVVLAWLGVGPNTAAAPMAIGSTDTRVGTAAVTFTILGVPVNKAVSDAGTSFGALGTIPASTWGVIAVDVVAAGTVTYLSGAANYTTGYTTEAAAIAALPSRIATKARLGYLTILASASTWVAATDALQGGSTGNPATTTNYYPVAGIVAPTGASITGGANGVQIGSTLAIGSTDYEVSWTAFTYNANGLANIAKAASTTGTAIGALGTCPADKCAGIAIFIDGAGTVTYVAAGGSCAYGYPTEAAAAVDAAAITVAGKCQFGYVTLKTKAATAWVCGTDAFAGGSTGNPASSTTYSPAPGITLGTGQSAAQIGNMSGVVISA